MPTSPSGSSRPGFVTKVAGTLTAYRMIDPGDSILVAASGGPDSTALLHALFQIAAQRGIPLAAAHIHHGLRGERADRDADFAARQASLLDIGFFSERLDVPGYRRRYRLSTEEAARRLRYEALQRIADCHGFSKIAVGHHADDSAESILMFLLRGSGPRGLGGVMPKRGAIIRPLIERRREEILAYLSREGIPFTVDETNADTRFLRNRIRHELIPQLAAGYNPNLVQTLLRLADIVRADDRWLETLAEPLFAEALASRTDEQIVLSVPRVSALPEAAGRRVIRRALQEMNGDLKRIGFRHIEAICRLLSAQKGSGELHLPGGIRAVRTYDRLLLHRPGQDRISESAGYLFRLDGPGEVRLPAGGILRLSKCGTVDAVQMARSGHRVAFFDMGKFYFPATVRNARPGDRFRPLGMAGTQKVSDLFVNRKVPRHLRWSCPVLICGDKIAWVVGHRMAEDFRALPGAPEAICAEMLADPF